MKKISSMALREEFVLKSLEMSMKGIFFPIDCFGLSARVKHDHYGSGWFQLIDEKVRTLGIEMETLLMLGKVQ